MRYRKDNPRIHVEYVDANTDDVICEVHHRNWSNVGELFTDRFVNDIVNDACKTKKIERPNKIICIAMGEYELKD